MSIVMLTFIATMGELRGSLPEINRVTIGEMFIIIYLVVSIFPVLNLIPNNMPNAIIPIHKKT